VSLVAVACVAAAVVVLSGCGTGGYSDEGNQSAGRDLFIGRCGGCHTLAEAGTAGTIGPNLDDAFAQAREDGMTNSTFTNVVVDQILFPITDTSTGAPGMPGPGETLPECDDVEDNAFCVDDQHQAAADIGAYVGRVAGTGVTVEKPTDGKTIFTTTCGGCHTLADAGTSGTVGPNLDQAKPPKELVIDRVTNGQGAMPSFKGTLDQAQIDAVADYVSSVAGK
jgi:mono/diheme cytochrome c family protein